MKLSSPVLPKRYCLGAKGEINQILPLILAFGFFALLLLGSLIFLATRSKNQNSQVPSAVPNNTPFQQNQTSSPFSQLPANPTLPNAPNLPPSQPSPFANSPQPSPTNPPPNAVLTEEQAKSTINAWLQHKQKVFAKPYDVSQLDRYLCKPGKLYLDITRSGGSIDWLRKNDYQYKYNSVQINSVDRFDLLSATESVVEVAIFEDLELITPKGVDRSKSSRKTQRYEYDLKNISGGWKVCNHRKIT